MNETILDSTFPELSPKQKYDILLYSKLLTEWNEKINLISRKDISNVLEHHILPCLAITKAYKFTPNSSILDIGTGGGLPGIPLAIANENIRFHLIDSVGKKITAVLDIIGKLHLKNATAEHIYSEDLNKKYDYIVGRSVKNIQEFVTFAKKNLKPSGKFLYLTGAEPAEEISKKIEIKIYNLFSLCNEKLCESKVLIEIPYSSANNTL